MTWTHYRWPEWIPQATRERIMSEYFEPSDWLDIHQGHPPIGTLVALQTDETVRGRWVPLRLNFGQLVGVQIKFASLTNVRTIKFFRRSKAKPVFTGIRLAICEYIQAHGTATMGEIERARSYHRGLCWRNLNYLATHGYIRDSGTKRGRATLWEINK